MKYLSLVALLLGMLFAFTFNTCFFKQTQRVVSYPPPEVAERTIPMPKAEPIVNDFEPEPYEIVMGKIKKWEGVALSEKGDTLLSVEIDIVSDKYVWTCGSSDRIFSNKDTISINDFGAVIRNLQYHKHFNNAQAVICVGTASSEGERENEEWRARKRALKLVDLVKSNLPASNQPQIYGANFGQYLGEALACSPKTLNQRRIILVKIVKQTPAMSLPEIEGRLADIFVKKAKEVGDQFPIDIRKYSKYKFNKYGMIIDN